MDTAVRDGVEPAAGVAVKENSEPRLLRWAKRHYLFVLTVVIPTLIGTLYFGFLAPDVYISESRFIVHSPEQRTQAGGLLGQLLEGTGISGAANAGYAVQDFVRSRDALQELDRTLDLRKAYGSRQIDVFDRFPGLKWGHSFEEFYLFYGKQIGITYDPSTSISILTVRAFTAEDAYRINGLLLQMSERLVNNLNERSRQDMIRFADDDVKIAEKKASDASLALLTYRSQHAVFEPDKQAAIQLQGVARLQGELVSTEAELAQLRKLSPGNPQLPGLESRADTLRSAIAREALKVTSASGSLSARAPEFERLALESELADKELGAALAEVDAARRDAARQQLYLERLVQPNLPDDAMEPRRVRSIFTVIAVGLILWGVMSLTLESIREHTQ